MATLIKALVILALIGAIAVGGAGTYYFLIVRPKLRDAQELAAAPPAGQATPDATTPEYERAKALKFQRAYPEARAALEGFLTRYPDSSHRFEAESLLGEMNFSELLNSDPGPGKVQYIVQRGDVLDRVAKKTKSDPELIFQTNGLDRIMLQIGQKLQIPQVDFSIEVHLNPKRLVVLNHGKFFKSYAVVDAKPLGKKVPEIHSKVQEKVATSEGRRVQFGSREYVNSLRSLTLAGQPSYTIFAEPDNPAEAKPSGGIGLAEGDAEELHTMAEVGTPVTITAD